MYFNETQLHYLTNYVVCKSEKYSIKIPREMHVIFIYLNDN